MKKLLSLTILIASLLASSCQKEGLNPEPFPPVRYLYAGGQGENGFQLWIWILEDESLPALVRSGMCRYLDGAYIDTDEERLDCRFTEEGFTLSDPATGEVRYTAANVEGSPLLLHISWTHSPGPTWDHYASDKGWQQEMDLQLQVFEGDDIVI